MAVIPMIRTFDGKLYRYSESFPKRADAEWLKSNLKRHGIFVRIVKTNAKMPGTMGLMVKGGRPIGKPRPGQYYYAVYSHEVYRAPQNWNRMVQY